MVHSRSYAASYACLRAGEAAAVHAVVDLGVDPLHHLVHLRAQRLRPQVRCVRPVVLAPLVEEVVGDPGEVVGDHLPGRDVDHRGHGDALLVAREPREVGLLQPLDPEHRVTPVRVEVEGPAAHAVGRAAQAERDHVLESEQLAHDDRPAGPGTGPRRDEPVATGLDRPQPDVGRSVLRRAAAGGDPVGDVVGLPLELAAGLLAVLLVHWRRGTRVVEAGTASWAAPSRFGYRTA